MPNSEKTIRAKLLSQTNETIVKHGHQIVAVFADENAPPFAYSVGLAEKGLPELILIGLSPNVSRSILNGIIRRSNELSRPLKVGPLQDEGLSHAMFVLEATSDNVQSYCRLACARMDYLGKDSDSLRALQIVWPDEKGRMPWAKDFNKQFDFQTLLGHPPLLS